MYYGSAREFLWPTLILSIKHCIDFHLHHCFVPLRLLPLLQYLSWNSIFILFYPTFFTTTGIILIMLADMGSTGGITPEEERMSYPMLLYESRIIPIVRLQ